MKEENGNGEEEEDEEENMKVPCITYPVTFMDVMSGFVSMHNKEQPEFWMFVGSMARTLEERLKMMVIMQLCVDAGIMYAFSETDDIDIKFHDPGSCDKCGKHLFDNKPDDHDMMVG